MINERRVKEMYHLAVYDKEKTRTDEQVNEYGLWDYVGKEAFKSLIYGTIAFVLMATLFVLGHLSDLTDFLNSMNYSGVIARAVLFYVGFIALYLIVTVLVYMVRYVGGSKKLRAYAKHLQRVRKMYRREEKMRRS